MKRWLILGLLALSACSSIGRVSEPDIAIAELRLGPGEGMYQTILVDLVITNTDSSPLKLNALSYRVRIEGRELAAGSSREPLDIAPGANVRYTVPATISLMSSFGFIKDVLMKPKNKINYELSTTLEPTGLFSAPFTVTKTDFITLTP
ncbi:MAG: hypothetical protein JWM78_2765 [Verrucomicrobiaceae bacterium]|nr:hypothetical protein [Verrucomicrobiaceae bacterium]